MILIAYLIRDTPAADTDSIIQSAATLSGLAIPLITPRLPLTAMVNYSHATKKWAAEVAQEPEDSILLPPIAIDEEPIDPLAVAWLQTVLKNRLLAHAAKMFTLVVFGGSNACAHDARQPHRSRITPDPWRELHHASRARWSQQQVVTPMSNTVCASARVTTLQALRHCKCGCIPQRQHCAAS